MRVTNRVFMPKISKSIFRVTICDIGENNFLEVLADLASQFSR